MLALVAGAVSSLVSLFGANAWLRHTADVRLNVAVLRSTLLDAETGMRGYLVTGAPSLLEPYERGRSGWRGQLENLRAGTTDNSVQQERLRQLQALAERALEDLASARATHDAGRGGEAMLTALRDENRAVMGARSLLEEMEQEEVRLDEARRTMATRRRVSTAVLFVAGALAFFIYMALAGRLRRAEETRRERAEDQRRLLEAVFMGIEDGITLQDRSGKLVFANASAARMIGFESPQALLAAPGREIMQRFELYDEEGRPFPSERLPARAILGGAPPDKGVLVRYRRDRKGSWRWSVLESYPVTDAAGHVVQAINVFRDVTARREAEERDRFLLRAVDELNSTLDYETTLAAVARLAVPDLADWCTIDIAEGGKPKRVTTAHADPSRVAAVIELERRYPPDPGSKAGVHEVLRTGRAQLVPVIPRELLTAAAVDAEHQRLIDELELGSYMSVPLIVGGKVLGAISFVMAESRRVYGEPDLAFARALADRAALAIQNARFFCEVEQARAATTEQLAAEERRRSEAEQQTRFAETFVGMLGHDLRNPLNAITITAKLMLRGAADDRDTRAIERILTSARRMSNMVTQLLDLTRSRLAGGITLQRAPVELGGLVSEVVDELRRGFPGREIVWTAPPGAYVSADRDRLAQVVSNLLGNALEHGDAARPVSVLLAAGADVALTVHNEGPPIAPDLLPVLFEPFRMTRGERSRGLGLGLFITEQIVLAHGGRVEVSSTAERGTMFRVHLPRFVNEETAEPEKKVLP